MKGFSYRQLVVSVGVAVAILIVTALPVSADTAKTRIQFTGDRSALASSICEGMTEGGCAYFKDAEVNAVWSYLTSVKASAVSLKRVEHVIDLDYGFELWRFEGVVELSGGGSEPFELYATTSQGLIDRVISVNGVLVTSGTWSNGELLRSVDTWN